MSHMITSGKNVYYCDLLRKYINLNLRLSGRDGDRDSDSRDED